MKRGLFLLLEKRAMQPRNRPVQFILIYASFIQIIFDKKYILVCLEWWSIMSVLKCASSLRSNLFMTYVKERLLPSTENTVTELWVIEFVS